jgi:hypothetical protein
MAEALAATAKSLAVALVRTVIRLAPFPEKAWVAEAPTNATDSLVITIISTLDLLFTCPPGKARITVTPAVLANAVAMTVVRARDRSLAVCTSKA